MFLVITIRMLSYTSSYMSRKQRLRLLYDDQGSARSIYYSNADWARSPII
ncbi:hypothetical protein Fmac_021913 [Flemingia macrophylla]|uniref:Uncharacterized protein n=1 Tax=Flemingia macrophylla TaxID=520843 RepID=A0ABD1LYD6_9FABA